MNQHNPYAQHVPTKAEQIRMAIAMQNYDPIRHQAEMTEQLKRAGAFGHISPDNFHETFSPVSPDIDSMKRANARVVETPKLK